MIRRFNATKDNGISVEKNILIGIKVLMYGKGN